MIKNQWYGVLDSKEVKKNKPVMAKRLGENLIFWRDRAGKISCIAERCCHRGASLGIGKIVHDHLQCPFHGFEYDSSGKVVVIPANGRYEKVPDNFRVKSYTVRDEYGIIWLWTGDDKENLPPLWFFEDLKNDFFYQGFVDFWPVHYTRAIENQLDVVHLPFVHHNTIGRGNKTLVNGPVVKIEDQLLRFFVYNIKDDGKTKPLKPDDIKNPHDLFELQFNFPNIWQNIISGNVRAFAMFAPVDEENTAVYIRFYQKSVTVSPFKQLMCLFANRLNRIILSQDKRVVITQKPLKTSLLMGENLIQGDIPIIEFRKKRDELLKL